MHQIARCRTLIHHKSRLLQVRQQDLACPCSSHRCKTSLSMQFRDHSMEVIRRSEPHGKLMTYKHLIACRDLVGVTLNTNNNISSSSNNRTTAEMRRVVSAPRDFSPRRHLYPCQVQFSRICDRNQPWKPSNQCSNITTSIRCNQMVPMLPNSKFRRMKSSICPTRCEVWLTRQPN